MKLSSESVEHVTAPGMRRRNYAWGVGGVADNLLTFGLAFTIVPIFNIGYHVNAFWLGVCIFIPRAIDLIVDPIMGLISDKTRSRWGRRRPYIFVGALTMAVLFALLWMPPFKTLVVSAEASGSGLWGLPPLPRGSELSLLGWICVIYTLVTIAYTVFAVPYIALGYELTTNTDVMTRLMASRLYFTALASLAVNWIYRLSVHEIFGGDETVGMRYVGVLVAALVALTGIVPALVCRESEWIERPRDKTSLREIFGVTLGNRAFVCVMGAMMIFGVAMYTSGVMGAHINIFYVAQGNKQFGTMLGAVSGSILIACNFIGMYLVMRLSQHFSKRRVLLYCLALVFVGNASFWWTWNPHYPYLQYASAVLLGFGSSGVWLMLDSMIGDVAKDDEARNGVQREGLYGASKCLIYKIVVAITSITGALALSWSGYQEQTIPSERVQFSLRLIFIALQCSGAFFAFFAIYCFPISRHRAQENERIITERKEKMLGS